MSYYNLNDKNIPFHENVDLKIFNKAKKILNNLSENGYIRIGKVDTGKVFYGYNVIKFYVKQDQYYHSIKEQFEKKGFIIRKEPGTISYRNLEIVLDKTGDSIEDCFNV